MSLVQAGNRLGIAITKVFLQLLYRPKLYPGDCLLVYLQEIGNVEVALAGKEDEFDDLQILKRLAIAEIVNQRKQEFAEQLLLLASGFRLERQTARCFV